MKLIIAEKPSVAQSIALVIGASNRKEGYLEGNDYLVSWCIGHLVELSILHETPTENRRSVLKKLREEEGLRPPRTTRLSHPDYNERIPE